MNDPLLNVALIYALFNVVTVVSYISPKLIKFCCILFHSSLFSVVVSKEL